jgi:hypothetical protein
MLNPVKFITLHFRKPTQKYTILNFWCNAHKYNFYNNESTIRRDK